MGEQVRIKRGRSEPATPSIYGCEVACVGCTRSCAVAQIQLTWWLAEQERLLRDRPPLTSRRYPAFREDLREAQGHLQRIERDIARACPVPVAGLARLRQKPALALVYSASERPSRAPRQRKTPEATFPLFQEQVAGSR